MPSKNQANSPTLGTELGHVTSISGSFDIVPRQLLGASITSHMSILIHSYPWIQVPSQEVG